MIRPCGYLTDWLQLQSIEIQLSFMDLAVMTSTSMLIKDDRSLLL